MSDATIKIPDSVMRTAHAIVDANPHHKDRMAVLVAKGIMGERERCAKIAAGDGSATNGVAILLSEHIAAAIRKGEA